MKRVIIATTNEKGNEFQSKIQNMDDGDFEEYSGQILNARLNSYGLWSEPSIQGGNGTDFWRDSETDEIVAQLDYARELDKLLKLAEESSSESEFKDKVSKFCLNYI